jgi:hypothetical protein
MDDVASRTVRLTVLRRAVISSHNDSTVASVFRIASTSERNSFTVSSISGFQVSNTLAAPSRDSTLAPIEDTAPMRLERLC